MKANSFSPRTSFLSIFILLITFSSCKKEEVTSTVPVNTAGTSSNWEMEADLIYDDGSIVHFKCNFDHNSPFLYPEVSHDDSSSYFFVGGAFQQLGLTIQGNISGPGNYGFTDWPEDGDIGVNINLMGMDGSTGESEFYGNYDSYSGAAIFNVISLANNHIKGTFSGKIFQDAGNKVITIENGRVETDLAE